MTGSRSGSPPSVRRARTWFLAGFALLVIALLVGPRIPDDQQAARCAVNVRLPGPFGVSLNCDSPEFMRLARHPAGLLEPLNTRQSRPGLVLAAAVIAWPLSPLAGLPDLLAVKAQRSDIDPQRISSALAEDAPAYVAYILLNVAILLWSFQVWCRIGAQSAAPDDDATVAILVSVGMLLVANDVVKVFFWSPHTQMLNIFVPVLALVASLRASSGAMLDRRFALAIGAIAGLGGTAYPLFAIVVPCIVLTSLIFAVRHWSRATGLRVLVNTALVVVLAVAPEALWYLFVRIRTGGFYQHEMAQGWLTWISGPWQDGFAALATAWWRKLEGLLALAAMDAVPLAALLVLVAAAALASRSAVAAALRAQWPVLLTAALVSAVIAVFYASVGLITARLAYATLPALIAAAGVLALAVSHRLERTPRRLLAYGCVAIALVQAIFVVAKSDTPW